MRISSSHGQTRLQTSHKIFKLLTTPETNEISQLLHMSTKKKKKSSNHTSNSFAKLTLQSSFSLFHYQFIDETTQATRKIHNGTQ